MTKREFLNAIVENNVTEDAIVFAQSEIAKLDKTNEQRRLKNAEKASATAPLVDKLVTYLTGTAQTATDLMEKFAADGVVRPDEKAWTPQYVSRLARLAVEEGRAEATEVKPTGGKGKQKAYLAIQPLAGNDVRKGEHRNVFSFFCVRASRNFLFIQNFTAGETREGLVNFSNTENSGRGEILTEDGR